jgi:hypothetical protein
MLRDLEAQNKTYQAEKKLSADINKELVQADQLSFTQRIEALQRYTEASKAMADADYKLKLQNAGLSDKEIAAFQADNNYRVKSKKITDQELIALAKEYENQLLQLSIDGQTATTEILMAELNKRKDLQEHQLAEIAKTYLESTTRTAINYAEEVRALNESLITRRISYERYLKDRARLDKEYQRTNAQDEIKNLEDQLALFASAEERQARAEKNLADLRAQYIQATTDEERKALAEKIKLAEAELELAKATTAKKIDLEKALAKAKQAVSDTGAEQTKKQLEDIQNAAKKLRDEVFNLIEGIGNSVYEKQKNDVQDLIDALDVKKEKDIEVANASIASTQERADAIKIIEARAQAQKEQLERRQRQIDQERARFEKAMNIARIIYQTATGVSNALSGPPPAPPNPILAAIIAATGALQLAKVVATPIPRYAEGTKGKPHPGGAAWVGDGGKVEVVREPGGAVYLTPDRPTLLDRLPKGSEVFPSIKEAAPYLLGQTMAGGFHSTSSGASQFQALQRTVSAELRATREAIKNKRETFINVSQQEISMRTAQGYNETIYLNKSLQF